MKLKVKLGFNIMNKTLIFLIVLLFSFNTYSQDLYPYGNKFPLGLYSLHTDLDSANYYGWNHGHRYGYRIDNIRYLATPMPDSYFEECKKNNLHSFARLSWTDSLDRKWSVSDQKTINEIIQQEKNTNISWWDMPEELRYWKNSEYSILKKYPQLIREYDTKRRPTYMYIPGHYTKEAIKYYVPFLDIIPASCYTNYQDNPHIYVRWSIERTKDAILDDGYKLGKDYLNNEKTVIAILELFEQENLLTKEGTWHDFWLAIACDVKGIQVFSHFYRNSSTTVKESWRVLNEAIKLFRKNKFKEIILCGENLELKQKIIIGPSTSPILHIQDKSYILPSLKILAKKHQDTTYVIAVNSSNESIIYQLQDIPPLVIESKNLISEKINTVNNQIIVDTLAPLGVSIFKFYTDQSRIKSIVFPSPSNDIISVRITNSKITFNKIHVFNIKGNLIYSENKDYSTEGTIELKNVKGGIYIMQLLRNNEIISDNKFIIY